MNKPFIITILGLTICAAAMTLTSCSDYIEPVVSSQNVFETNIIGKWKDVKIDGEILPTNMRKIQTFDANGRGSTSLSMFMTEDKAWMWANHTELTYSFIADNQVQLRNSQLNFKASLMDIDDNRLEFKVVSHKGKFRNDYLTECTKVTADYTKDIIGLWEGVAVTGDETYGDATHRIEYKADGTYTYYNKEGEIWVPSANVDNEYIVDGDWLATRWRPEADEDFNYEWWDIDYIKNGEMKWSAVREREDGSRFNTTFTWKKVE